MDSKLLRRSMLFNMTGAMVYYFCQWLLSIVIVRISGYEAAGLMGLAMTMCASPTVLSLFNVRNYQASDVEGLFHSKTYIRSRYVTNLLALVVCLGMILAGGYTWEKAWVVILYMIYKLGEGFADVYYGIEQRNGRLDYAGISQFMRGILTIVPFVLAQYLVGNLLVSLVLIAVLTYGVTFLYDGRIVRRWDKNGEAVHTGAKAIGQLLVVCIPLAAVGFLNNLSYNYPKIVLENIYGEEVMGYFSSLTAPALVVQLLANALFAPLVTPLAMTYQQGDMEGFLRTIKRFAVFFLALSLLMIAGAALLGRWGLLLLFGEGMDPYVYLFVPSILVTIALSLTTVLISLCTLVREIKSQYLVGAFGIITSVLAAHLLVPHYGMEGVLWAQMGSCLMQILVQFLILIRRIHADFHR